MMSLVDAGASSSGEKYRWRVTLNWADEPVEVTTDKNQPFAAIAKASAGHDARKTMKAVKVELLNEDGSVARTWM